MDNHEIIQYPPQLGQQICSSIFRNSNRKEMHIKKEALNKNFNNNSNNNNNNNNQRVGTGPGRFIKKIRDDLYTESWRLLFLFCILIVKKKKIV